MRTGRLIMTAGVVLAVLGTVALLGRISSTTAGPAGVNGGGAGAAALRLGLLSEGDVFEQRRRFRALADELERSLGRRVELVTESTYDGLVDDFRNERVHCAVLGPLGVVLLERWCRSTVLVHATLPEGRPHRRAVVFTRARDGPEGIEDLEGGRIALVRSTVCGELFAKSELARHGLLAGPGMPEIVWAEDPMEVMTLVAEGRVDAGATTDDRLHERASTPEAASFRMLATSEPLPEPALLVPAGDPRVAAALAAALVAMSGSASGRASLHEFGAGGFVPCVASDHDAVRVMVDRIGGQWEEIGLPSPPDPPSVAADLDT